MDFQLARNLSALARAQEKIAQALSHIDSLADCLNRDHHGSCSSEAIEQRVASTKTTLLQLQTLLRRCLMEEPVDYVIRKFFHHNATVTLFE